MFETTAVLPRPGAAGAPGRGRTAPRVVAQTEHDEHLRASRNHFLMADGVTALERLEAEQRRADAARIAAARQSLDAALDNAPATNAGTELAYRSIRAEIAAALCMSEHSADRFLDLAERVTTDYPAALRALRAATVSLEHVRVIVNAGVIVAEQVSRAQYEAAALELAAALTPAQLRPHAKRLAEQYADRTIEERHHDARAGRCVSVHPLDDGMAELTAILGAVEAAAIQDRLRRIAAQVVDAADSSNLVEGPDAADSPNAAGSDHTHQSPDAAWSEEPRTRRQIEADVFTDLLLSGTGSNTGGPIAAIRGHVQVTVPALTLIGGADASGAAELAGHGPIPIDVAKRLAANAPGWDRLLTHPVTGTLVEVDRYQPTAEQRRYLLARDKTCRFPGCTSAAQRCDIDHTVAAADGGPTRLGNLAHLCRGHHTLKHTAFLDGSKWRPEQLGNGQIRWRSPLGREYTSTPVSAVRFASTAPEQPPPVHPAPDQPPPDQPPPDQSPAQTATSSEALLRAGPARDDTQLF